VELTGPWQFRQVGAAPDAGPPAAGERWLPARVPGTVHTDLLDNGLIPDPFWGTNERDLQWIGERDWEYRSALPAADELLAHERIDLVFEGLDTYASVRLNDAPILEADNQYRAWRVPVKQWLHAGERGGACQAQLERARGGARGFDRRLHHELCALVAQRAGDHMQIVEARAVPGLQPHGSPDAAGHEPRAPVPAVVVRCLAGEHADPRLARVVRRGQVVAQPVVSCLAFA
jgi:hypothetical protein